MNYDPSFSPSSFSNPALLLAALQQQQRTYNNRAVAGLKPKKRRSGENITRSIMDELLRGGPVPTKLNNLRLESDTAKKSSSRVASISSEQMSHYSAVQDQELRHKRHLLESGLLAATNEYPLQFLPDYSPDPVADVIVGVDFPSHYNLQFRHFCRSSAPAFQAAIAERAGEIVKKLVKAILQAVTDKGGHFVTPLVGKSGQWCEVCRNMAERFTLQELRKLRAAQNDDKGSATTDVTNVECKRPKKRLRRAPPSGVEALYLLSEAAAKVK